MAAPELNGTTASVGGARRRVGIPTGLIAYAAGRLIQAIPLVLVVIVLNFALIKLAPGDPVDYIAPEGADLAYRERLRAEFGLDKPEPVQLLNYVGGIARGDLGYSIRFSEPVLPLILSRLGATVVLAGTGYIVSSALGVLLGVIAARRSRSWADNLTTLLALIGYSMPAFWLGQLLLIAFALGLGWFPTQGMYTVAPRAEGVARVVDVAHHLVLPAFAFSIYPLALIFRLTRVKMQDTLVLDYITTARAKGVSEGRITYRHALPNAFLPVLTVIGYNVGFLLVGAVLVENVFAWPGVGRLLQEGIVARDYPLILGVFTLTAILVVVVNVITDILYAVIDPRVTLGSRRRR